MSLEKPWAGEFDRLLSSLTEAWGGEIVAAGKSAMVDYFLYPEYRGELDGQPFRVEIKEFPGGDRGQGESGDNVEYLRIFVPVETEVELNVSHEHFLQRFRKLIRADWEFQTGAKDFDKRYWLHAGSERGKALLRDERFQSAVVTQEPFAVITIRRKYLLVSRLLKDAEQLELEAVKMFAAAVIDFAGMILD